MTGNWGLWDGTGEGCFLGDLPNAVTTNDFYSGLFILSTPGFSKYRTTLRAINNHWAHNSSQAMRTGKRWGRVTVVTIINDNCTELKKHGPFTKEKAQAVTWLMRNKKNIDFIKNKNTKPKVCTRMESWTQEVRWRQGRRIHGGHHLYSPASPHPFHQLPNESLLSMASGPDPAAAYFELGVTESTHVQNLK